MNINEDGCWPLGMASALIVIGVCEIPQQLAQCNTLSGNKK